MIRPDSINSRNVFKNQMLYEVSLVCGTALVRNQIHGNSQRRSAQIRDSR